jgi:TolB-like protein/AraC-like DNA-binding protein/Tfp pilus assembly protein PilF
MSEHPVKDQIFISKLTGIILENLRNENFSVKELVLEAGISHYSLNQRLHEITNKTIKQFIREVRLQRALEMLQNENVSISDVAFKVGFGSPAYFNTCFHKFFGFPPGAVKKGDFVKTEETDSVHVRQKQKKNALRTFFLLSSGILVLAVSAYLIYVVFFTKSSRDSGIIVNTQGKSIAVLPFKNLSDTLANQYYIDGVMEEILNNLGRIHDLRVSSRTSVEQFRNNSNKSIPEIAKALGVNYIVEGSGQKYGNLLHLTLQLIDAAEDKEIWTESYEKELKDATDIFKIQSQVAQSIAAEMKTVITSEEKQLIEKSATTNLTAYYFYQKGREEHLNYWLKLNDRDALVKAEKLYNEAIKYDSTFAQAYAGLALLKVNKNDFWRLNTFSTDYFTSDYLDSAVVLADRALKYDANLTEAYYVKGLYYWYTGKEEKVLNNIDKALEYNPNDGMVYEFKGFYYYVYSRRDQDYVKGIENLKKAISIDHGTELPELLNELGLVYSLMAGFPEEGEKCFNQALMLNGDSVAYLNYMAQTGRITDSDKSIRYLTRALKIDSTSMDAYKNLAEIYSDLGRYKESLKYFRKIAGWIKASQMTSGVSSHRIGYAYWRNGYKKEADYWFNEQERYCEQSIESKRFSGQIALNAYYDLACVYAFRGNRQKAYENLKFLEQIKIFPKWWLDLIKKDPLLENLRGEPEFQKIVNDMEIKYKAEHEKVRKWIEKQGML